MTQIGKVIAAVDIGTSKTAIAVGRLTEQGRVELLACSKAKTEGLIKGEVKNLLSVTESINEAAYALNCAESIDEIYVNVSGAKFNIIEVSVERLFEEEVSISKNDVSSMMQEAFNKELEADHAVYHIELQTYAVDGDYFSEVVGVMGKHVIATYKLFVGKCSYAKYLKKAVSDSCLRADRIVLSPLATAESVLSYDEKEMGVVLLEMGAGQTKLSIYNRGVLCYLDILSFAGNMLTKDLEQDCKITPSQAERLKTNYGKVMAEKAHKDIYISIPSQSNSKPREINMSKLSSILQCRLEDFSEWVQVAIENSGLQDQIGAGVVLTGGSANLENIAAFFKYQLALDVRIGVPRVQNNLYGSFQDPAFASVFGLLQFGLFELAREVVAPIQEEKKERSKQKRQAKAREISANVLAKAGAYVGEFMLNLSNKAESFLSEED